MMSDYQVVIIREAQGIPDFNKSMDDLVTYAKNPQLSTILVFAYKYKSVDLRKIFFKEIKKRGVLFESKKKYENELPTWISKVLAGKEYKIEQKSIFMLIDFLGDNLGKIAKELDKLVSILAKGTLITPLHIEENIGISKDFNNFELISAIATRDIFKANRIINYFAQNPKQHPILGTIPLIYSFFTKVLILHSLSDISNKYDVAKQIGVNPFFVDEYFVAKKNYDKKNAVWVINYLREADLKAKGVGGGSITHGDILKELIYKILH
jgi:DNA polymerase-3 subunit delta